MRLLRYGTPGAERPGLLDADGVIRDLSGELDDLSGAALLPESLARLAGLDPPRLPPVAAAPRLGPPVGGVGKIIGIGLNYADHAAEAGLPIPEEPIIFMKAVSALSGPSDPIVVPAGAEKVDWEVELAVVIGRPGKNIPAASALDHVAGFAVINDVSERSFQFAHGGQWVRGKSLDSFAPLGPWLVTRDAVPDCQDLDLWLEVNGERLQDGSTRTMIFPVAELIAVVSRFMSLQSGDVIATGTPPGVGLGFKPPRFLKPGDEVRLSVAGLGEQRQQVIAEG